jgi:AraC-like DNA-binding protein
MFQTHDENNEPLYQILNSLSIPIEVFAPDGTSVFSNRALIEFSGSYDASLITGKYNLINDPVCNDQLGMREGIQKAFKKGEYAIYQNYPVPIQDLVDRGIIKEKPFEKATMDYLLYPVWQDDKLHLVVCVFVVRSIYFGRPDVVRAKEYIDNHWQGEYDRKATAKSANMSVTQLYNLFKQHIGMTPGEYHKKVKVEHIKEKLVDKSLNIKEAFSSCGEDSRGWILRVFKEITGFTPTQFRKEL